MLYSLITNHRDRYVKRQENTTRYHRINRALRALMVSSLLCGLFTSIHLSVVQPIQAVAAPTPATDFLKSRVIEVLKLAALPTPDAKTKSQIDQQLLSLIKPLMNFPEMSKASLGKHWATRSKEEQNKFISLFTPIYCHR